MGIPASWLDHFLSVELSSAWRRHLIWSKPAGKSLREALTQRFASTTVFVSLILGTEIRTLFSPSKPADDVRVALKAQDYSLEYVTGVALCLSVFFSIAALIANFSAWGIFTVIGDENLKLVARSSIGLYGAQLPNRLVVGVIYMFYLWVALFWWVIMSFRTATIICTAGILLILHIVSTYSALARMIMDTGSMSTYRIMDQELEEEMEPPQLGEELLRKMKAAREKDTPVNQFYKKIGKKAIIRQPSKQDILDGESSGKLVEGLSLAEIADVDFGD